MINKLHFQNGLIMTALVKSAYSVVRLFNSLNHG